MDSSWTARRANNGIHVLDGALIRILQHAEIRSSCRNYWRTRVRLTAEFEPLAKDEVDVEEAAPR